MATVVDNKQIQVAIGKVLEEILNNKIEDICSFEDIASGCSVFCCKFKNKEVFGYELRVEFFGHFPPDIVKTCKTVLSNAIKDLPRADRIVRERIWNLK